MTKGQNIDNKEKFVKIQSSKQYENIDRPLNIVADLIKGAVTPCNKLFLNSTHLLEINFCARSN